MKVLGSLEKKLCVRICVDIFWEVFMKRKEKRKLKLLLKRKREDRTISAWDSEPMICNFLAPRDKRNNFPCV